MKALITISFLLATAKSFGQSTCALKLWSQPDGQGCVEQEFCEPAQVDMLAPDLNGKVRSLEVAAGFTTIFYQAEDLFGPHTLTVSGPRRIDDLATVPMLSLKRNWDNAIASFSIARSDAPNGDPVIPAMVAGLAR